MTDRRQLEWLWLSAVLGPGAAHCGRVLALYGTPGELYEAVGKEDMSGLLTPAQLRRAEQLTLERFAPLLARCHHMGVRVLCQDEEDYPARLAALSDAPPVLYCTGDVSALSQPAAVAMIGSRRPSSYGVEAAALIGGQLAQAGICLVSGLADGLDSEAHKAAVAAGAPTVGVLGTAIDKTYPVTNRRLRSEMEQGCGAVISEFAPGEATGAGGFLQRNRIIAALADAVCVVEARQKSGTMNTVGHAKRYGRTVFAVPGDDLQPPVRGHQPAAGGGPGLRCPQRSTDPAASGHRARAAKKRFPPGTPGGPQSESERRGESHAEGAHQPGPGPGTTGKSGRPFRRSGAGRPDGAGGQRHCRFRRRRAIPARINSCPPLLRQGALCKGEYYV